MKIEDQMELFFTKNKINIKYFDLEFLEKELKNFQENIQKVKLNDTFPKSEHIFSHIQIKRSLKND